MNPVPAPSAQIHHTGTDYWIMSFQDDTSDKVNVADSMTINKAQLETSIEMQLAHIYGGGKKKIRDFAAKSSTTEQHS